MSDQQHVASFFLGPFVDLALEKHTLDDVNKELEGIGIEPALLRDKNGWLSLPKTEEALRLLNRLADDPLATHKAGRAAFSAKYLGLLRTIIRAVASPEAAYRQMVDGSGRYNKVGSFSLDSQDPGALVLSYVPTSEIVPELEPLVCGIRQANIEALPTIFDLPPAEVAHTECIHRGGERCVYDVRHQSRTRSFGGLGLALVAAVCGALLFWGAPWKAATAAVIGGVFALLFAALRTARRSHAESMETVYEQQDALKGSAIDHERRFAELLEAKAAVDKQVEERTEELQRTTDTLAETLGEVEALSKARTDFFANMSHELRTPLTLLITPLRHLAAGREPPGGTKSALTAMERNADRLLRTINQLLDLARVEAGSATLERAPVSPKELITSVATAFQAASDAKGVTIRTEAASTLTFSLDAGWLETALTNLVGNALKFSGDGDTITISAADRGDEVVFEVSDTGAGIAPDTLETLFERFSRGSGAGAGTGIGLSLVHEAARLHEGQVDVESTLGEGSTFRVSLPRVLATGDAVEHVIAGRSATKDDCPSHFGPDSAAPYALVVEDNPDVRKFIVDILAVHYRVRSVRNGEEALTIIEEETPDILVSDVSMPVMDGLELSRRVRMGASTRDMPIVLVTARGESSQVLEGFDAGADDYVVKPFHGRELIARANALVRSRRMAGRLVHQERLATVGVVAASVAHHIRNPLNALIGGLPAVRSRLGDTFDASTHKMFDVFLDCAERIEDVTTDLLDLSRVDRAEHSTFPPGRGLAASVRLMETRFGDAIAIDRSIDEVTATIGRAGDLHHVFLNLLDNAARATGNHGRVQVVGKRDGEWYEVCVGDDGPGIPDELASRIFEPFVTTREAGEGTGLGLAIAKDVVSQHGGTIEAGRSELGGAEVKIRLPVAC